ncbi:GNAT family N-acetyltransferase [Paenibacillus whitsoniae]|uniref:N-acetyltransferase n=1 Tax=Paenibacillus whitsoniae TaxID=2496558 RepID=A0A430JI83_9BACL|nr:GNAT family N-acetyltransferase [Paenibacillus whitsoniae]RTE10720.1 N-acetyltransferase [Paenibacillus whitsoniae]
MNIREAHEGDYPELRKLYLESRCNAFVWDNIIEMTLEDFDKHTEDEFIIVAEEAGILMGFISLYLPDNFIHNLFVHPNCSGKGVGSRLLQAADDKMNKPMRLKCVSKNHKALTFYERNGWEKVVEEGRPGEEKYWVMEYK